MWFFIGYHVTKGLGSNPGSNHWRYCPVHSFNVTTSSTRVPPVHGDRTNTGPIQEILNKLERVRARKMELLVQLCAALRTAQGPPAPPQPRLQLRLRVGYPDSQGNLVVIGSRVRFTSTACTRAGTGRVIGWTNRANHQCIPDPYFCIERDIPCSRRFFGPHFVHRKSSLVTLLPRQS